jgi:STAS-like domain of unknown function (DUF4325)
MKHDTGVAPAAHKVIDVGTEFSHYPAGRFSADGPHSGEVFREKYLAPSIARGELIMVDLTGTRGLASSFLEEAFGGLIRVNDFSPDTVRRCLKLKTRSASIEGEIWSYISDAQNGKK